MNRWEWEWGNKEGRKWGEAGGGGNKVGHRFVQKEEYLHHLSSHLSPFLWIQTTQGEFEMGITVSSIELGSQRVRETLCEQQRPGEMFCELWICFRSLSSPVIHPQRPVLCRLLTTSPLPSFPSPESMVSVPLPFPYSIRLSDRREQGGSTLPSPPSRWQLMHVLLFVYSHSAVGQPSLRFTRLLILLEFSVDLQLREAVDFFLLRISVTVVRRRVCVKILRIFVYFLSMQTLFSNSLGCQRIACPFCSLQNYLAIKECRCLEALPVYSTSCNVLLAPLTLHAEDRREPWATVILTY